MSTSRLQNKTIKPYLEDGIKIRLVEKKTLTKNMTADKFLEVLVINHTSVQNIRTSPLVSKQRTH